MNPSDALPDDRPHGGADDGTEEKEPLTLEVDIQEQGTCQRHVVLKIAQEDIQRYFKKHFDELMPEAEVPGFRKGRAPRKLVEARFRRDVAERVKGELLVDSLTQLEEEHKLAAISEPKLDFDAIEVPKEGPMTVEFDLEVRPEFELPEWKGLRIELPTCEITDADVDRHLAVVLERYGTLAPYDGPAEEGDYLTLNMVFQHNGEVISRLEEETVRLRPQLSFSDGVLKGDFCELMAGVRAGETREGKVQLSVEAEDEELRGEEVTVQLEVLDVKRIELPELDQELLQRIGEFESEAELRDAVRAAIGRQLAYHQQRQIRAQITNLLTESADWELPPELVKQQTRRELERIMLEMQSSGFSNEEILAHRNELLRQSRHNTEQALKEHFILERIAEEEGIEDTEEDYDEEIARIAEQQGDVPRRVRARLEKKGQMDVLRNQIIERKVLDLIRSHAQFKPTPFRLPVSDTVAVQHAIGSRAREADIPEAKPGGGPSQPLPQPADHS